MFSGSGWGALRDEGCDDAHSAAPPSPTAYQSEEQETNDGNPAEVGRANDVAEPHGAHGDHQEVDALPVAHVVNVGKVGEVASVLQLISCRVVGGKARNEESELGVHHTYAAKFGGTTGLGVTVHVT